MTELIFIDFETRSICDLKRRGLHVYAADPTTDVVCIGMAVGQDGAVVVDRPADMPRLSPGPDTILVAHNAAFEIEIWNNVLHRRYGWDKVRPDQFRCSMAMAYAMALPGSLANAGAAVGLDTQKDAAGHRLMLQMSQPRSLVGGRPVWWEDDARMARLFEYCKRDVLSQRELYYRLLPLSDAEEQLWRLDFKINARGVAVDAKSVQAAIQLTTREKARLDAEMAKLTSGEVASAMEVSRLTAWLRDQGVDVDSLAKADVDSVLRDEATLPPKAKAALGVRRMAAKSSVAKLNAMAAAVMPDSRIRGMFQYHGASTGRWAGRRVQLHNLPRAKFSTEDTDAIFAEIGRGQLSEKHGPPMEVISKCLRGFLVASPGRTLVAVDFSAIEARVLAWLSGETKVLDIFRTHGKIYEAAASDIFSVPMGDVTKDQRQIGKVAILALGYGGGVGAFQKMASAYGVVVPDVRADVIKNLWREANRNIVDYWYSLERAAMDAVRLPGKIILAPKVKFRMNGSFLWCLLPSGRRLCYPYPKIQEVETPWGEMRDAVTYMGESTFSRTWERQKTYGGKLAENITQAVARDILATAMVRSEAAGFPVVMHVHDEVVVEVPEQMFTPAVLSKIEQLTATPPRWAPDLPLAVEGWSGRRYRKA